ncbi:MAG: LOG family protein [Planctomycetota bacterium]
MQKTGRRRYDTGHPELDARIEGLLEAARVRFGEPAVHDVAREILVSALRLAGDRTARGDLKLVNRALKELRRAFRVFAPYEHIRKVAVFGSARTPPAHAAWKQAHDFSDRICSHSWMVITGAGHGVMGAAQGGAGRDRSFGVNIRLPFEQRANEVIAGDTKLIKFRYFFTRKVMFVKQAHAVALFPGGFGTHDEGFEALTLIQTGKSEILPVVFVDEPGGGYWRDWLEYVRNHLVAHDYIDREDLDLLRITDDVDAAVHEILHFYSNYHSSRFVGSRLVLRLQRAPGPELLDRLNADFCDILTEGTIEASDPLPEEGGDAPDLARVVLAFNRRDHGRLRRLIDLLNEGPPEREPAGTRASPHEILEEEVGEDEWEEDREDYESSR